MPRYRPSSLARLNRRILKLAEGDPNTSEGIALVLSYVVAIEMMPKVAIKGGAGLKLRYGDKATRYSTDLDGARLGELDAFVDEYRETFELDGRALLALWLSANPMNPRMYLGSMSCNHLTSW